MPRLILNPLLLLSVPLFLASVSRADFLDGRCVNTQSQGVANVDIKAFDVNNGNEVTVLNHGTDANGFFHATVSPGTYQIVFRPPQPPASTDLITERTPVVISGTTNLGTVTLNPGFSISGTVRNPSNAGVPGLNLDVVVTSTGQDAVLLYDLTDSSGNFSFASPGGAIELRFDTSTVSGQTLAPREMPLNLTANTSLGTVQLAQGFNMSALVRGPSNNPIQDCDLDVRDTATDQKLYTPGDNTNSSGFVNVIVPTGNYSVDFFAPVNLHLAPKRVGPVNVSGTTNLGVITLQNGFVLSGHVQDSQSQPLANVAIIGKDPASGGSLPIGNNHTDASGDYAATVGGLTYNFYFIPPVTNALGAAAALNVTVTGDMILNATLPPAFTPFCFGDGSLATHCPCNNFGMTGRGCANSQNASGALLVASGTTHPDAAVLSASGMLSTALCVFLQGNTLAGAGIVFGDGLRCTGGSLKRIGIKAASGGATSYPQGGDLGINARSAALGDVIPIAATRLYQTYYRDPNPGFCANPPGSTFNVTSGILMVW